MRPDILREFIELSPRTLTRTGQPSATTPIPYEDLRGFGYYPVLDKKTTEFARNARTLVNSGRISSFSVTARDVFTNGVNIPKDAREHHGYWYTSTIRAFADFILEQRYGRTYSPDLQSPAWHMRFRRDKFPHEVQKAAENNNLWEFGVMIGDPNIRGRGLGTIRFNAVL